MNASDTNPLELYSQLEFVVFSGFTLEAKRNKEGVWKKEVPYGLPKGWNELRKGHKYNKNTTTFAIATGQASNIVVIDIDDPSIPHNKELMELMKDCSMVQQTKNGFHYVYQYDPRIPISKADDDLKLDVRSGDLNQKRGAGCIFCEPTHLLTPNGEEIVATYKWIKIVKDPKDLSLIPDAVIDKLNEIRPNYYTTVKAKEEVVENDDEEVMDVQSTSSQQSTTSNPTDKSLLQQVADYITNNNTYTEWLNNGIICYNEGLGLDVWEMMSKKSPKYERGACQSKWKTFQANPDRKLTAASWWKWLKDNNYAVFKELAIQRTDTERLYKFINHKEFANIFYNLFPNAYLYNERMGWFQLNEYNIWKHYPNKEPEQILRRISDTLMKYTEDLIIVECDRYAKERPKITDADKAKAFTEAHTKIVHSLETGRQKFGLKDFCKGILAFLPSYYLRDTLEAELNMNANLFAFADGKCVDFSTGQIRDVVPTDYISQTTGYNIPKRTDETIRSKLQKFLWGLFENDEVFNYFLRVCASCLYGDNRFHEYYVFTGSGGNGKGVVATLLESAFGEYYHSVDITLFTKPRERADQPIPALVDARYKRLMMTTEPEKDDEFQKGLLKKVSGGDLIEARTLFSKDIIRYKPQFKTIFQTNAIPKIRMDDGISRRMKIINFPFKFRPIEECVTEKHRVADPDIKKSICLNPEYRDEFAIWMIEVYNDMKDWKSFPAPNEVKEMTNNYFDDNNPIKFWLNEHFEITDCKEDRISASEIQRYYCKDRNVEKVNAQFLADGLLYNGIEKKRTSSGLVYVCIKRKPELELE